MNPDTEPVQCWLQPESKSHLGRVEGKHLSGLLATYAHADSVSYGLSARGACGARARVKIKIEIKVNTVMVSDVGECRGR